MKARKIIERFPAMPGVPVAPPPGLIGRMAIIEQEQPARAARAISGIVAIDGHVLIATVTADDIHWAHEVWRSIRALRTGP